MAGGFHASLVTIGIICSACTSVATLNEVRKLSAASHVCPVAGSIEDVESVFFLQERSVRVSVSQRVRRHVNEFLPGGAFENFAAPGKRRGPETFENHAGRTSHSKEFGAICVPVLLLPALVAMLAWLKAASLPRSKNIEQKETPDSPGDEVSALDGSNAGDLSSQWRVQFLTNVTSLKLAVSVAAMCHFCMSYCTVVIAGAMWSMQQDPLFSPVDGFTTGMLSSSILAGAAAGAACGFLADWIGRRSSICWVACFYIFGTVVMVFAQDVCTLLTGRAIAGFGVGLSSAVVNLYIGEVAPATLRGKMGAWAPLFGTVGLLAAYGSSALLGLLPGGAWRIQLGLVIIPATAVLLLRGHLPESPTWLVAQGRQIDAHYSLQALFPQVADQVISSEISMLSRELQANSTIGKNSTFALLWKHQRSLGLGVLINVLQHLTGINIIVYFGPTLLQMTGFSHTAALTITLLTAPCQVGSVCVSAQLLDRWGRRPVAVSGVVVMMIGLALLCASFFLKGFSNQDLLVPLLAVIGTFAIRIAFSFSLGPLPFVMTTELLPHEIRAVGAGFSWVANWIPGCLVCLSFPVLHERLSSQVGADFAAAVIFGSCMLITMVALLIIVVVLPETSGRRLEAVSG